MKCRRNFCKRLPERMAGLKSGLIVLVREVAPEVIWMHCMLHRESLVAKDMSAELSDVMGSVVKVKNIVRVLCKHDSSLISVLLKRRAHWATVPF